MTLLAWQSDNTDNSRWGQTRSDGTFVIRVPDGSYQLFVYAAPGGDCAGVYDGEGITTNHEEEVIGSPSREQTSKA